MKLRTLIIYFLTTIIYVNAQNALGTIDAKDGILYNGGKNAYTGKYTLSKFEVTCINTEQNKLAHTEIAPVKASFRNTFFMLGKDQLYIVEEFASRSKNNMYDDLKITAWDGENPPIEYNLFGELNGSKIRYAIANDEEIYFLLDNDPSGFDERSIYTARHSIARFNRNDFQFHKLKYSLSSDMESAFTSFWFPLRIGKDFSEWYRTKAINTRLYFEVQRIDKSGVLQKTKEFEFAMEGGVPQSIPFFPNRCNNIYFDYDAFASSDTSSDQPLYSMLATAILEYNEEMNKYFTSAKSFTPTDIYIQGVFYMLLDDDLNVIKTYEDPEIIKNNENVASLPKFGTTEYRLAFNEKAEPFLSIYYYTWSKKLVAEKHYEMQENKWKEVEVYTGLKKLSGNLYPGFSIDKEWRSNSILKSSALKDAIYAYTGKGMILILPSMKSNNVYFLH